MPQSSRSERNLARAEAAATRAQNAATEHARLARAVADRLPEGIARNRNLQLLETDRESVARSVADATNAVSRARLLVGVDRQGGANRNLGGDEIGRLADRAELDAKDIEGRRQALERALAKLDSGKSFGPAAAAQADAVASCANGSVVCAAPSPYCCLQAANSDSDGRGECVAGFDQCPTMAFTCTSEHQECPSAEGVVPIGCEDMTQGSDGTCRPGAACQCRFRFPPGQGREEADEKDRKRYYESEDCSSIPDCEQFCRRDLRANPKLRSSACVRLVDAGEALVNGSEGLTGISRGVTALARVCDADLLPPGGARLTQAKACETAAQQYFGSRKIKRDIGKAERYFGRVCQLSGASLACGTQQAAACIVKTWRPSRRTPDLDRWCNNDRLPKYWTTKAYLPEDSSRRVEFDGCFSPMREMGCTGVNVGPGTGIKLPDGQALKSAFCCAGERP